MKKSPLAVVPMPLPVELPTFSLDYIRDQLATDSAYSTWQPARLDQAILEYRRFLALCRSYPHLPIGISEDADRVWHRHILNTRSYTDDCRLYFGYYFHHTPLYDEAEQAGAQEQTDMLYLEAFGEPRALHPQATCTGSGCMNNG